MAAKHILIYAVLMVLLILSKADYDVNLRCASCTISGAYCSRCMFFTGGPFNSNNPICASAIGLDILCNAQITFDCGSKCNVGDTHFTLSIPGVGSGDGCTSDSDPNWNDPRGGLKQFLNALYMLNTGGAQTSYDWTKDGCWKTAGAIAGIVIGCIAFAAIIGVAIFCYRKKQAQSIRKTEELNSNLVYK